MRFFKNIFYYGIKGLLRAYTPFYFRSLRVIGRENLPQDGGLIFSPNHQGAFLDPLLVGIYLPGRVFSLTRGDVFVKPYKWIFEAMQMLPVFRIRNGFSNLKNNNPTFERCYTLLGQKKQLMMFSEGLHHKEMFLYPISKGSSRVAFQAQKQNPNTPIYLIPVGINYQNYDQPYSGLQLIYGTAIPIQAFLNNKDSEAQIINSIRSELQEEMKDCLWIPEDTPNYPNQIKRLQELDMRSNFNSIKQQLNQPSVTQNTTPRQLAFIEKIIKRLLYGLHYFPLLLTKKIIAALRDPIFGGSVKYAAGLFIFPLYFLSLSVLIGVLIHPLVAVISFVCLVISVYYYNYLNNT